MIRYLLCFAIGAVSMYAFDHYTTQDVKTAQVKAEKAYDAAKVQLTKK